MFTQYVDRAMRLADYELMEDGTYFGSIPGFAGVWANGKTLEECREDLRGSLEGWLILGLWMNDSNIPKLGKLDIVPRNPQISRRNEPTLPARNRKAS